jgi:hypothetical protein
MLDLLEWCYPRSDRHPKWHRDNIYTAMKRWAARVGSIPGPGGPGLYGPNAELRKLIGH